MDNFYSLTLIKIMISDSQIFLALAIALTAAFFAINLGRQLYI